MAGAGKTEALHAFAESQTEPVAVLAVGPTDRLAHQLLVALERACDRAWNTSGHPLGVARSAHTDRDRIFSAIGEAAHRRGDRPMWIMIDDFHHVEGTAAIELIEAALDELPMTVRLAIASRTLPDDLLAWSLLRHETTLITGAELAYRADEIADALALGPDAATDVELVELLIDQTAGWSRSIDGMRSRRAVAPNRSADMVAQAWRSSVGDEVLGGLSEQAWTCVAELAANGEITQSGLDQLMGATDANAGVDELRRRGLLLPTRPRNLLRLHPIVRDHVQASRSSSTARREPTDHGRPQRLPAGLTGDRLRLAVARADHSEIVTVLDGHWPELVDRGYLWMVERALALVDRSPSPSDPDLAVLVAQHGLEGGRAAGRWAGAVEALRRGDVGLAARLATAPPPTTPVPSEPQLWNVLAVGAMLLDGSIDPAINLLATVAKELPVDANLPRLAGAVFRAMAALELNDVEGALEVATNALSRASAVSVAGHPLAGVLRTIRGAAAGDDWDLVRGVRLAQGAGAPLAAYAGTLFLAVPNSRLSTLSRQVRLNLEHWRRQSADLGPIVEDRYSALSVRWKEDARSAFVRLTPREQEQLVFLASHLSQHRIALRMGVTVNTVKTNSRSIYRKLGVSDRLGAVERARKIGLLPLA